MSQSSGVDSKSLHKLIENFDHSGERRRTIENVRTTLKEFEKKFPFRKDPGAIDSLTSDAIYKKGNDATFFYWLERRLRALGHVTVYANWLEDASLKVDIFKGLLRDSLKPGISLHQRIDAPWNSITGFGGDRMIPKKIVSLYYHEEMIPIFKTSDLERFVESLGIDYDKTALAERGTRYEDLSVGEKFELLNKTLLEFKSGIEFVRSWDNALFMEFLYVTFPSPEIPEGVSRQVKPFHPLGLLFEPTNEQEIVYLFSLLHRRLGFPYVVKIGSQFPDAEVLDSTKSPRKIEFELVASNFLLHEHPHDGCDFIVCWENDLRPEQSGKLPTIISLKEKISEIVE